jgi:Uma2 family endonuclease
VRRAGGWIILIEPEVGLGTDIVVPDLAGWREERFPRTEEANWISVAPDWVCEILSPAAARIDRVKKMHLYARHRVAYSWLTDPLLTSLEVFRLESGRWSLLGVFAQSDRVRAEPFDRIELDLAALWLERR